MCHISCIFSLLQLLSDGYRQVEEKMESVTI
jgi:hypothetical protein